jgi:hypothetical protein
MLTPSIAISLAPHALRWSVPFLLVPKVHLRNAVPEAPASRDLY